jgi:hypothetical protein
MADRRREMSRLSHIVASMAKGGDAVESILKGGVFKDEADVIRFLLSLLRDSEGETDEEGVAN